jgi:4-cresol dehydrogenase (hydroxylating)
MPQPESFMLSVAFVPGEDDVHALIDALRPLKLGGTLRSVAHIANDLRLITGATTYPWREAGNATPLPAELRSRLRREAGVGAWGVSAGLYGTRTQVEAMRRDIRRALAGRGWEIRFIRPRDIACGRVAARLLRRTGAGHRLQHKLDTIELVFGLHTGTPTRQFLAGAYWRRRGGLPSDFPRTANPAADGCGLYWIAPVLPMTGAAAREVLSIVRPIFEAHRFELPVTFSMISERALGGVITIAFDRDNREEADRARCCHDEAVAALMSAGYVPYRVGLDAMSDLARHSDDYWSVVGSLKNAVDPGGIIAPGRYDPFSARRQD